MANGGVLVAHESWGIAVADHGNGQPRKMLWPSGWYGLRDSDDVVLTDVSGKAVARTGDRVALGGASGLADAFVVCGDQVHVLERAP